ncbi:DUF4349 domain-containing protein [Heliobacterium gestii]|uniref:DUF4349 domain-containing protein n=1 Tax=Heliomicrobium gestii TaxID=2699 RepID=A0A845L918_HELGE|nr:DUF4349 domain-containing protein [Heliomicrobium gestii]MBM7866588.1 hypothetical protein [Heliomicrobium gestii]MZP43132.1 DUF4349 domain-containing protein [Heliomicrobium gestii]
MKPVRNGMTQVHEFELWRQAELALRQLPLEMQPPDRFAAQIMERIAREQITPLPVPSSSTRPVDMRRWVASAAVFLLALGTGSGVYVAMQSSSPTGPSPSVVAQQDVVPDSLPKQSAGDVSKSSVANGETPSQADDLSGNSPANAPKVTVQTPQSSVGKSQPSVAPVAPPPDTANDLSVAKSERTYLLSKPMVIQRTLLRYRVASLDTSVEAVKKAIAQVNGQLGSVSLQQSQGLTIQNLTVKLPPDRLQAFIQALSLGALVENKSDNQDVTNSYQDMVTQVNFLKGQLSTTPAAQQPALSNKIQSLERQITTLDQESATHTVVLMMETENGQ